MKKKNIERKKNSTNKKRKEKHYYNENILLLFPGDIVVYDTLMEPWRPMRIVQNTSNYDDSVIDIAWSLDSSRLVSINRNVRF